MTTETPVPTCAWLPCTIRSGQFSGEYAVGAVDHEGKGFSLFAMQDVLRCARWPATERGASAGFMGVVVLQEHVDLALVKLPRESLCGRREFVVKRGVLEWDKPPQLEELQKQKNAEETED